MNKTVLRMLLVLTSIGIISGGALSVVYKAAFPRIERHRLEELKRAIFVVLPDAKDYKTLEKNGLQVYRGIDETGNPVGIAFEAKGNGFQGKITMMVGMDNRFERLTGMLVLDQIETPGLGARIAGDKFQKQFKGLSISPDIAYVKNKKPGKPNEIQAITAATISSKAVIKILNRQIKEITGTFKVN